SPYPGEWVGAHLRWGTKRPAGGLTSEGTTTWPWSGSQRVPALPGSTPWTRPPWRRAPGRWLLPSGRRGSPCPVRPWRFAPQNAAWWVGPLASPRCGGRGPWPWCRWRSPSEGLLVVGGRSRCRGHRRGRLGDGGGGRDGRGRRDRCRVGDGRGRGAARLAEGLERLHVVRLLALVLADGDLGLAGRTDDQ